MPAVQLTELIAQDRASRFLRNVVSRGRYGNAYLFHGPTGVGKMTAAIAFARAILCRSAKEADEADLFATAAGKSKKKADARLDDACGECASCRKSAELTHPDLKLLFPVSGEERTLGATINETLEAWREDPFYVFQYEKASSIRLSLTRDLLRDLAYKPFEAEHRVVMVRDADRMREDQYSAMLKAIEEPAAATVWILTSSRLARIPATIRSRCQNIRFAPWPEATVIEFLQQQIGLGVREARMLAALSAGSLSKALVLSDEDPIELRNQSLALLEPALRGDASALWKSVQSFMRFGRTGREALRQMIDFQQLWLRDLLRARYDAPREQLVNRDREKEIRRQAQDVTAEEVRRRLMVLEELVRAIDGNVTPELAMFSGVSRVAGARYGEGEWPKHATAKWEY